MTDRHVALEGCFNLRDLGGYETTDGRTTRWGRLYRSDAFHEMTPLDAEKLGEIGLHTVIDLRGFGELKKLGEFPLHLLQIDVHHVPIFPTIREWAERIEALGPDRRPGAIELDIAEAARDAIREVFGHLCRPATYPVAFNCSAGKDRTGVIAALVLSTVGVPDQTIVADYVLTQRAIDAALKAGVDAFRYGGQSEMRADDMAGFLAELGARWGSARGYLADIGITEDEVLTLEQLLLA
jgi:protein-tyrosine phosphatase